ncbi:MAG TPA: PKD domain-containing protein [Bryobacteraceae bacterium]|nr:PKD domain-containing protein [Bryobacteraceae bacterium]
MKSRYLCAFLSLGLLAAVARSVERTDVTFKIFQFPADKIPRVDGDPSDWDIAPDDYAIGIDQLVDTEGGHGAKFDRKDLDVKVKVGWVKGMNRLYFLYEAYDNYWDFTRTDLHNDIFEVVVDGDMSGGPLIDQYHRDIWTPEAVGAARAAVDTRISRAHAEWSFHGAHAQNYHIFTPPAEGKDWAMAWGCASWTKELPWANAAYRYDFKPGQSGKLILEFWITPFDYRGCEGPQRAVESVLEENKLIGLSWCVIDYDDVNSPKRSFWNLSHKQTMYGNASDLVAFRLMPLEEKFRKPIQASWSYTVADMDRRLVAFKDASSGKITSWNWDFGDGSKSTEQNPIHAYQRAGEFTVILDVEGPAGKSRKVKVWEVAVR